MKKILFNIRYRINNQLTWIAWYLPIYILVMFLVYFILINTNIINSNSGSIGYRLWSAVIFQFAVSLKFKEDFDLFITLSNSRLEIFQSLLGIVFSFSTFFTILILAEHLIIDYLNNFLGLHNIKDIFHYFAPYSTENLFVQFIFFLLLSTCCSVFGLLSGSLFYRFGKKFTLVFWLIFASIPLVFLPLLLWPFSENNHLPVTITSLSKFLTSFNVLAASGYLFVITTILSIITYINIRRLPQK